MEGGPATSEQTMGPRSRISFIMATSPRTLPYSATPYPTYEGAANERHAGLSLAPATQGGQLRHCPMGSQTPLRAVYGWQVSSGTTECSRYSCTIHASPPLHPGGGDALGPGTQLSSACRLS